MTQVNLGERALARGIRLIAHEEIDSTNDEAKRLVQSGEAGPLWIVARRQSKGRGRLGRSWTSLSGNLHASLIVSGFGTAAIAPQLGFVAGIATLTALLEATEAEGRMALKWPNDILLDNAKLAGILLEGAFLPKGSAAPYGGFACVIGIGVNCVATPADLTSPAIDLSRLPKAPTAAALFGRLSETMADTLDLWANGDGFELLRERWLSYAAGVGQAIKVTLPQETVFGRFETIDASGRLVLATKDGFRIIEAGDIFLPSLATAAAEPERRA
jgi:BirA family biotin operon repressor/biotin-[acetyl-CoA-carboxylase] ligase